MVCKEKTVCYMGKEMEECCKSKVKDALKRRTSFIMLCLSVALLILALTIRTADNDIFVDQVSFASTITSIILSVIAIWMSISGERQTGEIKEKVVIASDKLADTVDESQKIMKDLKAILKEQENIYVGIRDKITSVDVSLKNMFDEKKSKSHIDGNSYFINAMDGLKDWEYRDDLLKCIKNVFDRINEERIDDIIKETIEENQIDANYENMIVGMISVFYHNHFFDDEENLKEVKKYMK